MRCGPARRRARSPRPGRCRLPWVDRPELLRRLDDVGARRLVTVVAGASFGKSTLLAAWVARVHAGTRCSRRTPACPTCYVGWLTLRLRLPNLPDELGTALAAPLGPDAEKPAPADGFPRRPALGQALPGFS